MKSAEQMCRELLQAAVNEGCVLSLDYCQPEELTASDIAATTNLLVRFLRRPHIFEAGDRVRVKLGVPNVLIEGSEVVVERASEFGAILRIQGLGTWDADRFEMI